MFLNPNDGADCDRNGEIIVTNDPNEARPGIHHFLGEPTPDMEPIDDAAEKISAGLQHKWAHPIDTLPGNGDYSQSLFSKLESQLTQAINNAGGIPNASVPVSDFEALKAQVTELMAQNTAMAAQLAAKLAETSPTNASKRI